MNKMIILQAIGSTEPSTFNEFCKGLRGDCPTQKKEWATLFTSLRELEQDRMIEIDWHDGNINSLLLTSAGADKVRESMDKSRGLFGNL